MTDSTIHGDFAAVVHLEPGAPPEQRCWAVVKRTYRIGSGRLEPIEPMPLMLDVRDTEDPVILLLPGSDYRPFKPYTDVAIVGNAFAPGGRATHEMEVSVHVGGAAKRVKVLGDRVVRWAENGTPIFGPPEPFTKMSLGYENAYGGVDERLCSAPAESFWDVLRDDGDPIGAYPRNPVGKGYVAVAARVGDLSLPNLEDPDHRLTPENLIATQPERWYQQPLPWALGWMPPSCFPRPSYLGAKMRFPVDPSARLEEVERGLVPAGWRDLPGQLFFREASLGMSFHDLAPGTSMVVRGMHPERSLLEFTLPEAPSLSIDVEGQREDVEARIKNVVLTPDEERVEITWAAERPSMPRIFLPGIHPVIPITLYVDAFAVPYLAPPSRTVQLAEARRDGRLAPGAGMRRPLADTRALASGLSPRQRRERDQVPHAVAPRFSAIDPAAGRLLLRELDWTWPGSVPFELTRHYSSSMSWRDSALGPGWSHCLEQVVWQKDGRLFHRMADGTELEMSPADGRTLPPGEQVSHPEAGVTVRRVASDAYEVWHADGSHLSFKSGHATLTSGETVARLSEIWRADGTALRVLHDTRGRLDRLELGGLPVARLEHSADGRLRRVFARSRDGRDWVVAASYEYDNSGRLKEARDARDRGSTYRYRGRLLSERRASGITERFEYDGLGPDARCVAHQRGEDARVEVSFSEAARVVGFYGAGGTSFSGTTNRGHVLTEVSDVFARRTTRLVHEASGSLISQTDTDGEMAFHYADGQVDRMRAPARGTIAFEHDARGRLLRLVDAADHAATWGWGLDGRLAVAVDRAGASVLYDHPLDAPMASLRTPSEARVTLTRDETSGQVVEVCSPLGLRRARYDALHRVCEVVSESGAIDVYHYDAAGRVSRVERPEELVLSFDSDRAGRLLERHDGLCRLSFERDEWGRLAQLALDGHGPRLHRDVDGRVTIFESEGYDLFELIRDAAGRVMEELGFGGEPRYAQRDHRGLVVRAMRGRNRSDVKRDGAGRPTEIEHADGGLQRYAWSETDGLVRAQDADLVLELERDPEGRLVEETCSGASVRSGYDPIGARVSVDSSAGAAIRIQRDVIGAAVRLHAALGDIRIELGFERDASGHEVRRTLPGGVSLRTERDGLGRPTKRVLERSGKDISGVHYVWAGIDRMTRLIDAQRGQRVHEHDGQGRLVRVGGSRRVLDDIGCVYRTEARDDQTYGPGGRLIESSGTEYGYDEEGRRTSKTSVLGDETRYTWDALGRLVAVTLGDGHRVVYAYDGLGRMVRRRRETRVEIPGFDEPVWESEQETRFVWDGLTPLHTIVDGDVNTWLWEAGDLVGLLTSGGVYAVITEPNGAPTEVLDAEGETVWRGSVDMFGVSSVDVKRVEMPWRFAGHWQDPDTGLLHSFLRIYDPETGAYLTPNPLGVVAGANLYGYVPDPFSGRSPLGLGRGYETLGGEVASERLEAELIGRFVAALDRGDGAAGPRSIFDPGSARHRLPDPEAELFGPWDRYRPYRRMPPPTSALTRLPAHLGLDPASQMGEDRDPSREASS